MKTSLLFAAVAPGALALALAAQAQAQDAKDSSGSMLQEVVVTATKRSENVQTVPISITALKQSALERSGANRVEDVMRDVPGLQLNSNGQSSENYEIRGISTSTSVSNVQSPVAVFVDDLPILDTFSPRVSLDMRLFDVNRIEFLRGPQGTLFGSGAMAGAIRIITNKPDPDRYDAAADATVAAVKGGDPNYDLNAMVNLPLIQQKLALRIVGYHERVGGWIDNTITGKDNQNSSDTSGARAQLRWIATSNLTITGLASIQKESVDNLAYTSLSGRANTYDNYAANAVKLNQKLFNGVAEYDFGFATLTSSTTYEDKTSMKKADFTRTGRLFTDDADAIVQSSQPDNSKSVAEEIRLASKSAGRLQWLVGGFYLRNTVHASEYIDVPGAGAKYAALGFPSDVIDDASYPVHSEQYAAFGEATYSITDKLKATVGGRYFYNKLTAENTSTGLVYGGASSLRRTTTEHKFTPKFVLSYQALPTVFVYAQAAEGYRVGQNNLNTPTDPISGVAIPQSYGPDHLWNYEAGVKSTFFNNRLLFNAAVYYIDWRDIQLSAESVGTGLIYVDNAGDAKSKGAEFEVRFRPVRGLEIGSALSFNRSKLTSVASGVTALKGDRLPGAPRFTAGNYVQYDLPLGDEVSAYARIDHQYTSKEYSDLYNPTSEVYGEYHSVNARLGVDVKNIEIAGFVNNVFNATSSTNVFKALNSYVAIRQQPRTVGLTLRAKF